MPDIYRSGETIPEIGGSIEGGTTIVVHRPQEVEGLIALAALAGRPPEDPMAAIARELQAGPVNLEAWKRWERRRVRTGDIADVRHEAERRSGGRRDR